MKILTKDQLRYLLEKKVQSDYVELTDMVNLFDFFGDDYFSRSLHRTVGIMQRKSELERVAQRRTLATRGTQVIKMRSNENDTFREIWARQLTNK